jgi:hypothetical protein
MIACCYVTFAKESVSLTMFYPNNYFRWFIIYSAIQSIRSFQTVDLLMEKELRLCVPIEEIELMYEDAT